MKKIALICLALVVALGGLGIGYAMWSDTVTVVTTVQTGTVNVELVSQKSNDPGPNGLETGLWFSGSLDPKDGHQPFNIESYWTGLGTIDPTGWTWVGPRYIKNVASANCTFTPDTLTIDIENAYPSYGPDVAFAVQNTGTIPAKVYSIKLVSVTTPAGTFVKNMNVDANSNGTAYLVKNDGTVDTKNAPYNDPSWAPGFDDAYAFSMVITSIGAAPLLGTQLEPGSSMWGDVGLHVAQSATQNANYSFTIRFTFANFNE